MKNNRVYVLSNPALLQEPSPRVIEGLLVMAKLLHPDLFNNLTTNILNDTDGQFNNTTLDQFG
ncbi:MAG: hypothetical protein QW514_06695 [Thermoprotei archaeon]